MNKEQEKEVTSENEKGKQVKKFKEAEYHKPPDRDDSPPPPTPSPDQEDEDKD